MFIMKTPRNTVGGMLLLQILLLALGASAADVRFRQMTPLHGPPGTRVVILGENFAPGPGTTVHVGSEPATLVSVTPTALEFRVPESGASGIVEVVTGAQTNRYPVRFTVTRQV